MWRNASLQYYMGRILLPGEVLFAFLLILPLSCVKNNQRTDSHFFLWTNKKTTSLKVKVRGWSFPVIDNCNHPETANPVPNADDTERSGYCPGSSFLIRVIHINSDWISEINGYLSLLWKCGPSNEWLWNSRMKCNSLWNLHQQYSNYTSYLRRVRGGSDIQGADFLNARY